MLRSMYDFNMFNTLSSLISSTNLSTLGVPSTFLVIDTTGKGRAGGNMIRNAGRTNDPTDSPTSHGLTVPTTADSRLFFGCRCIFETWSPEHSPLIWVFDSTGNNTQVSFTITSDGTLNVMRAFGGALLTSVPAAIPLGTLFHLGIEIVFSDTGSIRVVLNGINEILNLTGVDTTFTSNNSATSIRFGQPGGAINTSSAYYISELFVGDGVSPGMTSLPGDVGISHLTPTADGTYTAWTPSTGSAWDCVDETVLNTADYISTTGAANKASFQVSDLTAAMGGVKALAPFAIAAKPEAGDTNVACGVITNSTEVQGTTHAPGATSTLVQTIYEKNPVTANDWTSGEVNALQVLYTSV